ncbi:hypothetical protein Tco_1333981, partial [Tanacetum coccineum]
VIAPVVDIEEDLAALFRDDDFEDDASDGFDMEEIWEVHEEWLMAPVTPPPMLAVPRPSVYEVGGPSTTAAEGPSFPHSASGLPVRPVVIEDLSTHLGNLEYGHGQLVKKVIQVSDAGVASVVTTDGSSCAAERQKKIQQLQTTVAEMGTRESSLMQCILGLDRRLAALERRPPGPQ